MANLGNVPVNVVSKPDSDEFSSSVGVENPGFVDIFNGVDPLVHAHNALSGNYGLRLDFSYGDDVHAVRETTTCGVSLAFFILIWVLFYIGRQSPILVASSDLSRKTLFVVVLGVLLLFIIDILMLTKMTFL